MYMVPFISKHLFPHISRIFSAAVDSRITRYVIGVSCLSVFIYNLWLFSQPTKTMDKARISLLSSPFSVEQHTRFAQELDDKGYSKEAEREFSIASQLYGYTQTLSRSLPLVLGAQSSPHLMQQQWRAQSTQVVRQYDYWRMIVEQKPDYRDAFVTLAVVAHTLKKTDEATQYLKQAYVLDPNNEQIHTLAERLKIVL